MARLLTLILVVAIAGGSSFCERCSNKNTGATQPVSTPTQSGPAENKVVFCLFDLSGSTKDATTRKKYSDSFKRILDKIAEGDVIVADAITDNPLSQSSFPVNEEFPEFNPGTDNEILVKNKREEFDAELRQRLGRIAKTASDLLNDQTRKINRTKILDSMQLAERVFHTYTRAKKVLVIFSDMIEASDRYNFLKQPLNESERRRIIAAEKNQRLLPDLAGVCVYVVGAAVSDQRTSLAFENIESFWIEYFRAAGGDLTKDRYGALLSFGECAARTTRARQSCRVSLNGQRVASSLSPGSHADSDQWLRRTSQREIL